MKENREKEMMVSRAARREANEEWLLTLGEVCGAGLC